MKPRVLLISHTCQSPTEGQPKAIALGRRDDLDLKVVVPTRWKHYGQWRPLEVLADAEPWVSPQRVVWPWMGPAQFYLHWYPGLKRVLRDFRPDVIDLWEEPWGLVSVQAARLRDRVCPGAAVLSETEQNLDKRLPFPFERFRTATLRRADFLVGRSEEAVAVARAKGYAGPAESVPNAADVSLFEVRDRAACRAELGLPAEAKLLGYVGRLVEAKGLDDLWSAMARMDGDVHAVVVGDGPERARWEQATQAMGLAPRVHWLGAKPLAELPTVMNALDALVLPSRTTASWKEQFGRVLIEAEACGVPALGSDSGAIGEVIGDAARVFAERDPAALAAAAGRLLADPSWAAPARREALRRRVVERFSWEAVAERYAAIYARLAADRAERGAPPPVASSSCAAESVPVAAGGRA